MLFDDFQKISFNDVTGAFLGQSQFGYSNYGCCWYSCKKIYRKWGKFNQNGQQMAMSLMSQLHYMMVTFLV